MRWSFLWVNLHYKNDFAIEKSSVMMYNINWRADVYRCAAVPQIQRDPIISRRIKWKY